MGIYNQIFSKIVNFIHNKRPEDLERYWFSYNFRVKISNVKQINLLHFCFISEVNDSGFPWKIAGVAIGINNFSNSNKINFSISEYYIIGGKTVLSTEIFYPRQPKELTKREFEIA